MPFDLTHANVSLDAAITEAIRRLPGFRLISLSFPDKQEGELVLAGSVPSSNSLRSIYGSQVHDIRRAGLGAQVYDMFIPLHHGTFGGWPIKLRWCLGSLAPGVLAVSGFLIWRARRRR